MLVGNEPVLIRRYSSDCLWVRLRELSQPIGGLLLDLARRGLLDETLVVFATEFGRTGVVYMRERDAVAAGVDSRYSIGLVMMSVALAAVNLALARATPFEIVIYPSVWVVLVSIDFLIVWKLLLRRPFRAFPLTPS